MKLRVWTIALGKSFNAITLYGVFFSGEEAADWAVAHLYENWRVVEIDGGFPMSQVDYDNEGQAIVYSGIYDSGRDKLLPWGWFLDATQIAAFETEEGARNALDKMPDRIEIRVGQFGNPMVVSKKDISIDEV